MAKLLSSQPVKQSREAWLSPRPYLLIFIWIFCIAGIDCIMLSWRKYFKSISGIDYMLDTFRIQLNRWQAVCLLTVSTVSERA